MADIQTIDDAIDDTINRSIIIMFKLDVSLFIYYSQIFQDTGNRLDLKASNPTTS